MNKKFILSLIIFFILITGLGFFYVVSKKTKTNSNLMIFVPKETVLYLEYNLTDKNLMELDKDNFSSPGPWQKIWQKLKVVENWPRNFQNEIKKIGYAIVKDNNQEKKIWLVEVNNVRRAHSFLPEGYADRILTAEVMALAKDKKELTLVESNNFSKQSEAVTEILENFSADNFLNVYLSPDYYKKYLTNQGLDFLNKLNLTRPIFLGLKVNNQQLVFDLDILTQEKELSNFENDDKNIAPLNSFKDLFLVLKLADGQEILDLLTTSELLNQQTISDDLKTIFRRPVVFFSQIKKNKIAFKNITQSESYNYGLAVKLLVNKPVIEQVNLFKDALKKILAFRYPQEKTKKLPDGTKMTELVADKSVFEFKQDGALEYVDYPGVNLTLAIKDGYLILSNNQDLLKDIVGTGLKSIPTNQNNLPEKCLDFSGQEIIFLNTGMLENSLLNLTDSIAADVKQDGENVEIKGCIK